MNRRTLLTLAPGLPLAGFVSASDREIRFPLRIHLDPDNPGLSFGEWSTEPYGFVVGLGHDGVTPEGQAFRGGSSLLGTFRINAILSASRFEMIPELIEESGKTEEWLRENLFRNMSSIDFDGDGEGGEYGDAFVGLEPLDTTAKQPFHFGEYKGIFRWYSYALHGTQDESRIGKCVTGGCINVGKKDLAALLPKLSLGDLVKIGVE